jgi:hypothetical protein
MIEYVLLLFFVTIAVYTDMACLSFLWWFSLITSCSFFVFASANYFLPSFWACALALLLMLGHGMLASNFRSSFFHRTVASCKIGRLGWFISKIFGFDKWNSMEIQSLGLAWLTLVYRLLGEHPKIRTRSPNTGEENMRTFKYGTQFTKEETKNLLRLLMPQKLWIPLHVPSRPLL